MPYFAYRLRLIVHRDSKIAGWDDLRRRPGQKRQSVGVLRNSADGVYGGRGRSDSGGAAAGTGRGSPPPNSPR